MEVVRLISARGGVARLGPLLSMGITERQLRNLASSGSLIRPGHGIYALPDANPKLVQAAVRRGMLTCVSAAGFYRLWQLHEHDELHLKAHRGTSSVECVVHRKHRVQSRLGDLVAPLADALLDALHCLPWTESLPMVQSAVSRGEVHIDFLRQQLKGNRNAKAAAVLDLLSFRADSILECLAAARFRLLGIRFEQHVHIDGVGEVDFVLEGLLIIELDGATHFAVQQIKKDRRRDNLSTLHGYLVLRYFYDDVVYGPEQMMKQIVDLLARGRRWPVGK